MIYVIFTNSISNIINFLRFLFQCLHLLIQVSLFLYYSQGCSEGIRACKYHLHTFLITKQRFVTIFRLFTHLSLCNVKSLSQKIYHIVYCIMPKTGHHAVPFNTSVHAPSLYLRPSFLDNAATANEQTNQWAVLQHACKVPAINIREYITRRKERD